MSCILNIETSTNVCSVALSQDGVCLYEDVNMEGPSHAQVLAGYVKNAVSFADSHAIPIDAIAISKGPGSYTGLRIGVSEAKGVAYGRDAKLLSVPTLKLLTVPILLGHEELPEDALLCPMIDARRMEVYCALYDRALNEVVQTQALVLTPIRSKITLTSNRYTSWGMAQINVLKLYNTPMHILLRISFPGQRT